MSAFLIIVRVVVTVSTLLTLLGPTFADAADDDLPVPPDAEPSEPDERDTRPRPSRRERRDASHLDARDTDAELDLALVPRELHDPIGGRFVAFVESRAEGRSSTQFWFLPRGAARDGRGDLLGGGPVAPWQDWPPTWPDAFTTGSSCAVSCIRYGKAHDNGPGFTTHLNVRTTTPVRYILQVTNTELGYSDERTEHQLWVTAITQSYHDLEPGTTYQATVTVWDANGEVDHGSGWFTTSG